MVLLGTNHEHRCQLPLPPRCTVERVIRQGYIRQVYLDLGRRVRLSVCGRRDGSSADFVPLTWQAPRLEPAVLSAL